MTQFVRDSEGWIIGTDDDVISLEAEPNTNKAHLQWIYMRLRIVHGESKREEHMRKFASIINSME